MKEIFDFYNKSTLKSYNLNESMRYQLNMLDSLDAYTRKHSENVANITCRICEYLRLNKNFTVYTTICAYLHDIGKLFIPPEILQKATSLTDEEYDVMKTHTTIGYNMCMSDKALQPYGNGALYHHESLNGTGYPNGVHKKNIPIEGQIIRVADEFDAIVSKRQYKTHINITETLKIIIDETHPPESMRLLASKQAVQNTRLGKLNKIFVKALLKIVIEDTEYEISCIMNYVTFIKKQIVRLKEAEKYYKKMIKVTNDKQKQYYVEGIKMLLKPNETVANFLEVLEEYTSALEYRENKIKDLFLEIKKIKKLRV